MSVLVRIPTPLRRVTNGQDKVNVEGSTLGEVVGYAAERSWNPHKHTHYMQTSHLESIPA